MLAVKRRLPHHLHVLHGNLLSSSVVERAHSSPDNQKPAMETEGEVIDSLSDSAVEI